MEYPYISWRMINGFRNLITHQDFGLDTEEVWQLIEDDLARFMNALQAILP